MKPKFEVGDLVAVYVPDPPRCYPMTRITAVIETKCGDEYESIISGERLKHVGGWNYYGIQETPNIQWREDCIRKINPDEYIETEATQEETA